MGRIVSLSFDDGRWDVFTNVVPIMKKYGLTGTINVITDFVEKPEEYRFKSCKKGSITKNQIRECESLGFEIAAHGHTHQNSLNDIMKSVEELRKYKLKKKDSIGFASPQSYYCKNNYEDVMKLVEKGDIAYLRSGIQTKREGILYAISTYIERKIHSKYLYYLLNRQCIFQKGVQLFFVSVSVTNETTVEQILYLISKMNNNDIIIFNFHSILKENEPGFGCGKWFWDIRRFDLLCKKLSEDKKINITNTINLVEE